MINIAKLKKHVKYKIVDKIELITSKIKFQKKKKKKNINKACI